MLRYRLVMQLLMWILIALSIAGVVLGALDGDLAQVLHNETIAMLAGTIIIQTRAWCHA